MGVPVNFPMRKALPTSARCRSEARREVAQRQGEDHGDEGRGHSRSLTAPPAARPARTHPDASAQALLVASGEMSSAHAGQ